MIFKIDIQLSISKKISSKFQVLQPLSTPETPTGEYNSHQAL
jgi:hypothetical protein